MPSSLRCSCAASKRPSISPAVAPSKEPKPAWTSSVARTCAANPGPTENDASKTWARSWPTSRHAPDEHPPAASAVAEIVTEITKAQFLAWRLGRLKEAGKATHFQVSMAKRNNVGWALRIARICRDMLGANGILDEYQTMRHMVNLESVNTYEGTFDIHTLAIGEAVTGIPAYR